MAKVYHVKKARKSNRKLGIKKGESYWWIKRRMKGQKAGIKIVFLSPPKPSQLTCSPFMKAYLAIQEQLEAASDVITDSEDIRTLAEALDDAASELESLADEQQEALSNLPQNFQESDTAELLRNREEKCRELAQLLPSMASDVNAAAAAYNDIDGEDSEELCEGEIANINLAQGVVDGIDWSIG